MPEPTQHTPGPWRNDAPGSLLVVADTPDGERIVAGCWGHNDTLAVTEGAANARLIAAAPEMLAALESILRAFTDAEADRVGIEREDAWQARAGIPPWVERIVMPAIRKAKGGAS